MLAQYAEIARLAGGLAHEIRNPLSTISLNLDLLVEELGPSDDPRDRRTLTKLETVRRECVNLEDILDAFLQFARVGELELEHADLNQVVSEFLDFYRPQADEHAIEISPHLEPDLPAVAIDRSLIRQLLMNLFRNAQQAMPGGGRIEVQTAIDDGRVKLVVIDNGDGIDERSHRRMFDPFFSTRPGGSGLGLPTVRKIVEAHHGTLGCESEPGRGTKFTISLPATTPTTPATAATATGEP